MSPTEPSPTPSANHGPRALPYALAASFFVLYAAVAVRRHQRGLSGGYDLGIFEQAIRNYAHFHAPVADLKGPGYNVLGDHFHPILAVLAPAYRLFPTPLTLLVAQAALLALTVVPITRWAQRTRGLWVGVAAGIGTGCAWGIVRVDAFDFHEVCFAVPLLAFAVEAAGRERWRAAACWALPLLLVKEDLGLTVAMLGLYIAWRGPRRLGVALAVVGVLGTLLEMFVLIPAASAAHTFDYLQQLEPSAAPPSAPGSRWWPPTRLDTTLLLLAPTAFLALRSPLALLALPTLGWRFASHNNAYWGTAYHYNGVLVPIVFGAMVDVLARERVRYSGRRLRRVLAGGLLVTAATLPAFPLATLVRPATWTTTAHQRAALALARAVPSGATVAASNQLAAQLTDRATVSMACPYHRPAQPVAYLVVDTKDTTSDTTNCRAGLAVVVADAERSGYTVVAARDGITLLRDSAEH
ncbi:DUF2079 domain-containing protein [Kitasatospora sp. NBC_01287]|uniref:DUF2079 domain-containing protein n=1 Tax=Kitasatospora sp. NBC_01287 TaxID=2903573 RepID=UPI00225BA8DB|nr:DUF2079 domain-containing protein [Kitasatospora sp. NBC_01287]MCX4749361.1 DUF2079 domain-containing protein [Kitasatospora sp. NBC_01287]